MKMIRQFYLYVLAVLLITACNEGIDPINPVAPGADEQAPTVTIDFPIEGTLIRVKEDITSINIKLQVIDDIEIESISIVLDDSEIANFNEFKDYRRALKEYLFDNLTNGSHTLAITAKDISGKTTTETVNFEKVAPYNPVYDGEIFYMPFDGDFLELVNIANANEVGSPNLADGKKGKAYSGATDSYITLPSTGLLNSQFSAAFWYKVNAEPDRAGILVLGPPDEANPTAMNNRLNGFRLFRENAGGMQRIKLNVGHGAGDSWYDGGAAADIDPSIDEWVHIAFTISETGCAVYFDGQIVSQGDFVGVDWSGCDILSIASGAPRFVGWGHLSDNSLIDELRLFYKALSQEEIQVIIDAEN